MIFQWITVIKYKKITISHQSCKYESCIWTDTAPAGIPDDSLKVNHKFR